MPILARVREPRIAENLRAFGTPHIINPFEKFAEYLVLAMREPGCYRLLDWLTGMPGTRLRSEYAPPRGEWVVCGYGRFGKAIAEQLHRERLPITIVDPAANAAGDHAIVVGLGTEQAVLRAAGIESAEGLVAATDDDFANLAIAVSARALNPRLFIVLRQNLVENRILFERYKADLVMVSSEIVAQECLALLMTPLLAQFLAVVKRQSDAWADDLIARLQARIGEEVPVTWGVRVTGSDSPAVHRALAHARESIRLDDLLRNPSDRDRPLDGMALMRVHAEQKTILPAGDTQLAAGDEILFAGTAHARALQTLALQNPNALEYVRSGREVARAWVWRKMGRVV